MDRTDRTAESTAEDSVIAGDRKDHQQHHRETKDSGRTFKGMNNLGEKDGIKPADYESVTIVALTEDGEIKASGKTGFKEKDLEQAALPTSFRHGHTVNPIETAQEILKAAQDPPTGMGDSSEVLASNIAPNAPNPDQMRQFDDIQTDAGSHRVINPEQSPETILIGNNLESKDAKSVVSDMNRGDLPLSGTLLPEPWMVKFGGDFVGALTGIAAKVTASKFQEIVDAVKKAVVNPIEHPFRGHEEETLTLIPAQSWSDAYKAYPDLKEIGGLSEAQSTKLMKAIIGNELTFYGPEDKAQDAICEAGQGSAIHGQTVGFAQIAPDGVRNLSAEFDNEVKAGIRTSNPLRELAGLPDNDLAKAMIKPENLPILVGAVLSHNVQMFNRHKGEVEINPLTLGYSYNPDRVYAKSDKDQEHLLTKKEAVKKGIPYDPALPNKEVLSVSDHAHNIAKWLQKLGD